MITDALGTHLSGLADAGELTALASCPAHAYGGGFDTSMGAGWTQLAVRTGPCRAANAVGDHYTGDLWHVRRESTGEFICYGRSYGYGSTIWYQDSKGWSWSGGTSDPQWNKNC